VANAELGERAAAVVARFSAYATRLVPLLFVCGVLLAVLFVRSLAELATPYGAMVLGKAAGFAAVLVLAAFNKWRYAPRLALGDRAAAMALGRTAVAEWALLAVVLAATAVMTSLYAPEHLEGAFGPGHAEPEHPVEE
jgi:putative copper export protein